MRKNEENAKYEDLKAQCGKCGKFKFKSPQCRCGAGGGGGSDSGNDNGENDQTKVLSNKDSEKNFFVINDSLENITVIPSLDVKSAFVNQQDSITQVCEEIMQQIILATLKKFLYDELKLDEDDYEANFVDAALILNIPNKADYHALINYVKNRDLDKILGHQETKNAAEKISPLMNAFNETNNSHYLFFPKGNVLITNMPQEVHQAFLRFIRGFNLQNKSTENVNDEVGLKSKVKTPFDMELRRDKL